LANKAEMLGGIIQRLGADLYGLLADEGIEKITVAAKDPRTGVLLFDDGHDREVRPELSPKCHIPAENKPKFYEWLRAQGCGSLIKEVIYDAALNKWIEEWQDAEKPLPPQELLKITELESVSVKRSRKSAEKERSAQCPTP
jgi:hypothetical protein